MRQVLGGIGGQNGVRQWVLCGDSGLKLYSLAVSRWCVSTASSPNMTHTPA